MSVDGGTVLYMHAHTQRDSRYHYSNRQPQYALALSERKQRPPQLKETALALFTQAFPLSVFVNPIAMPANPISSVATHSNFCSPFSACARTLRKNAVGRMKETSIVVKAPIRATTKPKLGTETARMAATTTKPMRTSKERFDIA